MNKYAITRLAKSYTAPGFAAAVESERNRLAYINQSAATRDGKRADFSPSPAPSAAIPSVVGAGRFE